MIVSKFREFDGRLVARPTVEGRHAFESETVRSHVSRRIKRGIKAAKEHRQRKEQ
jgi:hypothetical protein